MHWSCWGCSLSLICLWRSKFFPPLWKPAFSTWGPWAVYSLFTHKAANAVVVCLIMSTLDYCNSLLAGLPHLQILQAAQNVAARVVVRQKNMISSPSTLRELHWLPVQDCMLLKLLSDTDGSVHVNCHTISLSSFCHTLHFFWPVAERVICWCSWAWGCKRKPCGQRAFRDIVPSRWNAQGDRLWSFFPIYAQDFNLFKLWLLIFLRTCPFSLHLTHCASWSYGVHVLSLIHIWRCRRRR